MTPRKSPQAPPFCPNPDCVFHTGDTSSWRCVRIGTFQSRRSCRPIQRHKCLECGRSFSTRTFKPTYWLKRPEIFFRVAEGLVSCSGYRQLATNLRASPQTIARHAARLGKQSLLFHEAMRRKKPVAEPLALDSFVTFAHSQYFPVHVHWAVGRESHFAYGFTESECRRSGTMTAAQKGRREWIERTLGKPDPKAREQDVAELLRIVLAGAVVRHITTDEDQAYPRAIRRTGLAIRQDTISSRALRIASNPLFAINLTDLQARHNGANHKRETIAFSKTIKGLIERMWLLLAWKNYVRPFSVKRRGATPAMRAGITDRAWTFRQMFRHRLFPLRVGLPERWRAHFEGTTPTRAYGSREIHPPAYAY